MSTELLEPCGSCHNTRCTSSTKSRCELIPLSDMDEQCRGRIDLLPYHKLVLSVRWYQPWTSFKAGVPVEEEKVAPGIYDGTSQSECLTEPYMSRGLVRYKRLGSTSGGQEDASDCTAVRPAMISARVFCVSASAIFLRMHNRRLRPRLSNYSELDLKCTEWSFAECHRTPCPSRLLNF
jgi:hypothetical protein